MQQFIEQVISNLESNGFPDKRVSLPMEKMFEIADKKGFSFNAVMDEMKKSHEILSVIDGEKIIFSRGEVAPSQDEMMKKAQDMMSQMDPAELERMKDMFMNMSEDEKSDIMKKGKDLGLV